MNHPSLRAWVIARAKLSVALGLLPLAAGSVGAQGGSGSSQYSKGGNRSYDTGKYALEINGVFHSFASGVQGGYATSDVVTEKPGPDRFPHKHLAGVKYEDISMNVHPSDVAGVVKDALSKETRMNGKVMTLDYAEKPIEETDFFNGIVTGFELPPLDAASKEACYVTLTLTPELTKHVATPGGAAIGGGRGSIDRSKKCFLSNFEVSINGLEDATKHVNHVEGIAMTQKVPNNAVGEQRDYDKGRAHWDFSNVTLTLPESQAKPFVDWLDSFVIKGNNGERAQKTMTVKLLDPDMKTAVLTLEATGVGIFKLSPEKVEAGSQNIRRIKAEMYVTKWDVLGPVNDKK